MAIGPKPGRLSSEDQIEQMETRLRRIFVGSVCLSFFIVLLLTMMVPGWSGLPAIVRYSFPAVLLWSMVVTAYGFYAQLCVTESMKESLRHKTFIDEVTGVYNYRYLDRRLAEETERTRRHGGLTAVLYMDLDGFKQVNDQFGHQVGNIVLEQLATTMSRKMRSCDVFGRIGGDEFLAILPQTDRREAYVLAERLRETVENYALAVEKGRMVDFVRVSVGVAAFPVNGENMDNVITAADNAVYDCKSRGGNRVIMAGQFVATDAAADTFVERVRGRQGAAGD
jgi:diguanylate cyclase (GGDEF)-like protein